MGFGTMGLGYYSFGGGLPTTGSAPPTNTQASRYLDPVTRDYEFNSATANFTRMTPIRQRVQLALSTIQGSSTTQPEWGIKLPTKITERFPAEARAAVRAALSRLTDVEKVVRLERIDVETHHMRSRITVYYIDLTTNARELEELKIG